MGRSVVAPRHAGARVAGGKAGRTLAHRSGGLRADAWVLTLFLVSRALSCDDAPPYTLAAGVASALPLTTTTKDPIAMAKGKRTYQPNTRRRARRHGFRQRMRTRAGRSIVAARRRKGRARLTA